MSRDNSPGPPAEPGAAVAAERSGRSAAMWRIWALVPLLLLVAVVSVFVTSGGSLIELVGRNPPPADAFDVRRVEFAPGTIGVKVTNPQRDELTIGQVTVDDAVVPFSLDGPRTLRRLGSTTIVVAYPWVDGEPLALGITSSSGVETAHEVAAATATPTASARGFLGYGLIGFLVGIVPVALGLLWLPSLRHAGQHWLSAFMAVTAGLLTFLAFDALEEALALQALLPAGLGGPGLVVLGVAASYLGLSWISARLARRDGRKRAATSENTAAGLAGSTLALMVAVSIGVHNLGEGLAIGSSFALGELTFGTFLIVGFMVHNVTEGLGIAAPVAEGARVRVSRLAMLTVVAGAPAILGTWIGGYLTSDLVGVLFFALAVGAAAQVVIEIGRHLRQRVPGGLSSGWVIGGFLVGIVLMWATGLIAG